MSTNYVAGVCPCCNSSEMLRVFDNTTFEIWETCDCGYSFTKEVLEEDGKPKRECVRSVGYGGFKMVAVTYGKDGLLVAAEKVINSVTELDAFYRADDGKDFVGMFPEFCGQLVDFARKHEGFSDILEKYETDGAEGENFNSHPYRFFSLRLWTGTGEPLGAFPQTLEADDDGVRVLMPCYEIREKFPGNGGR